MTGGPGSAPNKFAGAPGPKNAPLPKKPTMPIPNGMQAAHQN